MFVPFWADFVGDDAAGQAAVVGDLLERGLEHAEDDIDADSLVALGGGAGLFDGFLAADEGDAAARQNAFFDGRTRGVQRVFNAGLLLLHVGFARSADRDDGHAAGQLGEPLLQLLAIVIAGGAFDGFANLVDPLLTRLPCLPAPWTIVVLSLVTVIFFARPSSSSVMFSSFLPRSSLMTVPPVSVAISASIALRRSPKPGAFTAHTLRMPRSLLTTSAASASPSTSSAMINSGFAFWLVCSRIGSSSRKIADLLFVDQDVARLRARIPSSPVG